MNKLRKKLRLLWRRRQLERDLDDELQLHLDMKTPETGDRAEAARLIGNSTSIKETCRDLWTFTTLETWWQDIRYAVRTLRRAPTFVLAAVVALALGIGADTAVFTIAFGALTWNLGLDHVNRTVLVDLTDSTRRENFGGVSYPDFDDLRARTKSLAGLAAYRFMTVNLSDTGNFPERCWLAQMSANGFSVSEQKPAIGRVFNADDERSGAPHVVVLTHHIWQDRYGGDPSILGKKVFVDTVPTIVIGVMPVRKRFPEDCDLWTPLPIAYSRSNRDLMAFGRLADGATFEAARTELKTIAAQLAAENPVSNQGLTANVRPIAEITGVYLMRSLFAALWAAVGFVLLIACADVANMLLARGAGRRREIAIRVAIGAGRARLVRQLLIESVLLSITGGCLGWLVAVGGLHWFEASAAGVPKPVWLNLSLDRNAFLYLASISIGTGLLLGLAPSLRLARVDVHAAMKDGGLGIAGNRRTLSLSNILVAVQMALCIVLLAGAGLMIRSALNMYAAPIGVDPSHVLTMHFSLPAAKYPKVEDMLAFHRELKERLAAIPGTESASIVTHLPLGGYSTFRWQLGNGPVDPQHASRIGMLVAGPDYFRVMRASPIRGRVFTESDVSLKAPVALVNESFVAKYWPGQNALGRHFRMADANQANPEFYVIGVVPDILQSFTNALEHVPLVYVTLPGAPTGTLYVVARTRTSPDQFADPFRRAVKDIDSNLAVYDLRTLDRFLSESRLSVRLLGGMFTVFAVIALVLAAVGLYAVVAHSISQRTQEIGVRMALGSTREQILGLVFAQAVRPMILGMLLGLPAALLATRVLRLQLVGVSPTDPVTFLIVILVLVLAGILGCAIPARRATRVDPIVALRYE